MTVEISQVEYTVEVVDTIVDNTQTTVVEIKYQGLQTSLLQALTTRVDTLDDKIDDIDASTTGAISPIASEIDALEVSVAALAVDAAAEEAARIAGDAALSASIAALTLIGPPLQANIDAEAATRAAADSLEITNRNAAIAAVTNPIIADVDAIELTIGSYSADISAVEADVVILQADVAGWVADLAAIDADVVALTADVANANDAVSDEMTARGIAEAAIIASIPTTENIQDIVGAEIVAGANVTVTYDDGAGTVTIATTASGLGDGDKGDITVTGTGATWTIDPDVVTFAKMQNIDTAKLLGRATAATGDIEEITLGTNLSFTGTTLNAAGSTSVLAWKDPVRAATTAAGTLATSFANGQVIDGVTLVTADRILLKNQAAGAENGIYTVNASGAPTRATDMDASVEVLGATCFVSEGTANGDKQFTCTTNATITLDTTALVFAQISGGSSSPTTTAGDLIRRGASVDERLAIGSTGQVLTVVSGAPAWAASASGGGPSNPVNDGALIRRNASEQTVTHNTSTAVTFDTEVWDDGAYANLGTNNDRLTITNAGWYTISGCVYWDANTTGLRVARLNINGLANSNSLAVDVADADEGFSCHAISTIKYLNSGDYVQLVVYQNSGATRTLTIEGAMPNLAVHRLGIPSGVFSGASVSFTGNTTVSSAAKWAWSLEEWDTDNYWTSGSPSKLTIPANGAGKYLVTVTTDVTGSSDTEIQLWKNGVWFRESYSGGTFTRPNLSCVLDLQVGDYLECVNNAGTYTLTNRSTFSVSRLSGTVGASGATGLNGVAAPNTVISPYTSLIPRMTSATAPSGTASASNEYPALYAWQCINTDRGDGWLTNNTGMGAGHWIKYDFGSGVTKIPKSYGLISWHHDSGYTRVLTAWKLQGSNDDTNWTDLHIGTAQIQEWPWQGYRYFSCGTNTTAYRYFRIFITGNGGNAYIGFTHWELYDTDILQLTSPVGTLQGVTHVDAPPVAATAFDDEFDTSVLDSKWVWRNQGTATAVPTHGSLVLTATQQAGDSFRIIEQSVSGSWKYRGKFSVENGGRNYVSGGLCAVTSGTGKVYSFSIVDGASSQYVQVNRMTNVTTYSATSAQWVGTVATMHIGGANQWVYQEIESDGTNIYFRISGDGIVYTLLFSEALATWLGTPDKIGIFADDSSNNAILGKTICDWFRQIPAGYTPGKFIINGSAASYVHTVAGRLTLTSGTPITVSDVTGATSVYFTPFNGDTISLWSGSTWGQYTFTEKTLALGTLTSGKPYDVFGYLSSNTLALEALVWTNDTTRATAVTLQDGRYCKSGDKTRLYLGTFYTTSTTTTEDSISKRYLFNQYNRAKRMLANPLESTASWTYTTATWRQARASATNQFEYVNGDPAHFLITDTFHLGSNSNAGGTSVSAGVGLDSTSVNSARHIGSNLTSTTVQQVHAQYKGYPGAGRHYVAWLEISAASSTTTWYGPVVAGMFQSGIFGELDL